MKNLHLISTDKPSRLQRCASSEWFDISKENLIDDRWKYQNIYITSDEEIKERDWHLNIVTNKISTYNIGLLNPNRSNYKKIILTIDQDLINDDVQAIDDEFLEWFVKNPSCEEVNVESYKIDKEWEEKHTQFNPVYPMKIKYKIIIPKEEPCTQNVVDEAMRIVSKDVRQPKCVRDGLVKQETLEEAAFESSVDYKPFVDDLEPQKYYQYGFEKGAKWQQERMYSEEEVYEILAQFVNDSPTITKEWFEQFKKK
ncbi:MAG: hypothetical protein WCK82_12945 [Bacteroidota bacterium]